MQKWHQEGLGVKKISERLERSTDTISKHLFKKHRRGGNKPLGRPAAITDAQFAKIIKTYETMLAQAKNQAEVTAKALKVRMRLKCTVKTLGRAFWARGVFLRRMYEKPALLADDVKTRMAFAVKYKSRSEKQWAKTPEAVIDNKVFPVYTNGQARDLASRRRMRGTYRTRKSKVTKAHTKPSTTLKQNTGAHSAIISCAIGCGRVLMWHHVKGKWNGDAAAAMYAGPLRRGLQKASPNKKSWTVMEDNDPTGYKSRKGLAAKSKAHIKTLVMPKRSPDLNPLDYSVWAEVNRRMRKQEATWPSTKKKSRDVYLARLRRTAFNLPPTYINKVMGSMAKRCAQVIKSMGGHFPEGA